MPPLWRRPSARCRALLVELSKYLDGDLTPARRRTVERHLTNIYAKLQVSGKAGRAAAAALSVQRDEPPRFSSG